MSKNTSRYLSIEKVLYKKYSSKIIMESNSNPWHYFNKKRKWLLVTYLMSTKSMHQQNNKVILLKKKAYIWMSVCIGYECGDVQMPEEGIRCHGAGVPGSHGTKPNFPGRASTLKHWAIPQSQKPSLKLVKSLYALSFSPNNQIDRNTALHKEKNHSHDDSVSQYVSRKAPACRSFTAAGIKTHTYPEEMTRTISLRLSLTEGVRTYVSSMVGSLSPTEIQ